MQTGGERSSWSLLLSWYKNTTVWYLSNNSFLIPQTSLLTCQDAMLVALKSLMPACLFNVIWFGSTFKTLFPSSQTYSEVRRGNGWDQEGLGGEEQRQGKKRKEEVTQRSALKEPMHL